MDPLNLESMKEQFQDGIRLQDCQDGIALLSSANMGSEPWWWVDLSEVLGPVTLQRPRGKPGSILRVEEEDRVMVTRHSLEDKVNLRLYDRQPPLRLYA